MDLIDKNIIFELLVNCRVSYQTLAKKMKLSVNGIKKRIEKLTDTGIIRGYSIRPSLAMMDAEGVLALITIEDPTKSEIIQDTIGNHPMIYAVSLLTDGSIICYGFYRGSQGLDELGTFLRQVPGVMKAEIHTIMAERGSKCELKQAHLKVIQCLREDARMRIGEIAHRSRLTPRRVRKTLKELTTEGGSKMIGYLPGKGPGDIRTMQACFYLRVDWDLNAGGYTAAIIRIDHDEGKEERSNLVEWLKTQYPFAFWYAYSSAPSPTIFSVFVVEHIREVGKIVSETTHAPGVTSVKALLGYPTKSYPGLRESYFDELKQKLDSKQRT
ncbi:MAG: winged helix-turn-helix transcriptional regulator [Candidatus Odinarchaeota archaeon]